MAFGLKCPECRKMFRYSPLDGHPRFCPLCDADIGGESRTDEDNVIAMPAFLSAKTRQNDKLYREIEASSEQRVQQAAEMAGCDPADMSGLKITDLRSTKHEGDVAAVPVQNAITQQMDFLQSKGAPVGFGAGQNGSEFGHGIATGAVTVDGRIVQGIEPRAGARAAERTQKLLHGMR